MKTNFETKNLPQFDPFQKRICRDIRNELSKSFMKSLETNEISISRSTGDTFKNINNEAYIHSYIDNRLARYQTVLEQMSNAGIDKSETDAIALLLWDQELFFEVHEWLENNWVEAAGTRKIILQALIRAAGTYILFKYGRIHGAEGMAKKAKDILAQHKESLPSFLHIELLIEKLKKPDPIPPKLGADRYIAQRTAELDLS